MAMDALAAQAGVPVEQAEALVDGLVGGGVAQKLGMAVLIVQDFIDGDVKPAMATELGLPPEEAKALRERLGREGAVGLVVGLLLERTR